MKITKQFSILIACFAMIYSMSSCKREKFEPNYNDCTVDVILCSDLENSVLPDSLQKLFAAAGEQQLFPGKDNSKIQYVPSGTLRRIDLSTPVELTVKYELTAIEKIQNQLKKPTEKNIEDRVDNYLQGVDVASLNSKEKVDPNEKINRIKAFIEQKQNEESPYYSAVLFYSVKPKDSSWNDSTVYHNMDAIRSIVFSNPKAKYLLVYNPPAWVNIEKGDTVSPVIKEDTIPTKVPVLVTSVSLNVAAQTIAVNETFQLKETILPNDASNKAVSWKSNKPAVVEIDSTGLVTAKSEGSATITATTQDGGKTASCKITVTKVVTTPPTPPTPPNNNNKDNSNVKGTKKCSCVIYEGSLKNGYPEGEGKATYKCKGQIAKHDKDTNMNPKIHTVEAGDYFVGSWGNGDIISGALYDRNGNIKERIIASKRSIPYDICNDF